MNLSHGGTNIAAVLQKFSEAGIEVTDISMQKPSLESVFLKLTGRELRD
jgi:ABC-type multidrug transport system ATPase subunit